MYTITDYTKRKAKEIGVTVKPSRNPKKKIDVYKEGQFIQSLGDINYFDYPTYIKEKGLAYANERRELYYARHTKNSIGENLSKYLLW